MNDVCRPAIDQWSFLHDPRPAPHEVPAASDTFALATDGWASSPRQTRDQVAKDRVDTTLQSAKEAVGRQNKSSAMAILAWTVKQIDQMGLSIQTGQKPVDDRFSDIKDRLTQMLG